MREIGHYWVKLDNNWEIAFFTEGDWFIILSNNPHTDDYLDCILL